MSRSIRIAAGPALPEFGSWRWIGDDLIRKLSPHFVVDSFSNADCPPQADVVIFVKFLPSVECLQRISRHSRIVYFPIDVYGSCHEIDQSGLSLRLISLLLVNSRRLARYFAGYCEVAYIDHPLKYVLSTPRLTDDTGPLIWIGRRCNINPVVDWANEFTLNKHLHVLTDFGEGLHDPNSLGFRCKNVSVEEWSETKHLECLRTATVAVDIKGNGFRARHKPPAKTNDFLASGIPVISNFGSSVDHHMSAMGLSPLSPFTWEVDLNQHYRQRVLELGHRISESVSPTKITAQLARQLLNVVGSVHHPY